MKTAAAKPVPLSPASQTRLNMYALAATTAGVSAIALVPCSAAQVVFTPVDITIGANQQYGIDLNGDGITDFTVFNQSNFGWSDYVGIMENRTQNNRVVGVVPSSGYCDIAPFGRGVKIGPTDRFCEAGAIYPLANAQQTNSHYRYFFHWTDVKDQYLGFAFRTATGINFGWARMSIHAKGLMITTRITGYAYESTPNTPIRAGQKSGNADIDAQLRGSELTAQPFLGALALGANGISIWRK